MAERARFWRLYELQKQSPLITQALVERLGYRGRHGIDAFQRRGKILCDCRNGISSKREESLRVRIIDAQVAYALQRKLLRNDLACERNRCVERVAGYDFVEQHRLR